nr:aldehyde dehydrogenase [Paenibacillus protaetiae]
MDKSVPARLQRLSKLKEAIKRSEPELLQALRLDLNKSETEAYMTEIGIVYSEISHTMRHLKRWAKPKKVKTALTHAGSRGVIIREPYGTVLIIAPWNYPFQLVMSPLVGAIAGGNTAVIKPSELSPHVSAVIAGIVSGLFPPEEVMTAEGGVEVSTALLEQPFDYIFFTGSTAVGKAVMEAAAKRLIPVTLELGGKSPCVVHRDADLKLAAKRILFGKLTNAGQTCIAPDYLLVHQEVKGRLLDELKAAAVRFYGDQPLSNPDYGRIINKRHFDRLVRLLQDGTIVHGGQYDEDALKIAPTFIEIADWESPVMQEEIFGPIMPILAYSSADEVVDAVTARPKPLAFYLFTGDRDVEKELLHRIPFGGGCVNDTLMHIATPYLPFGGVGESGMGGYHGESSFQTFTHAKSVLKQTTAFDFAFRYPSARNGLRWLKKVMK